MSATIRQMVLRKRAAAVQAAANAAAYDQLMAQAKGDPGMNPRGEWQKDTDYFKGDVVSRKGSSYICVAPISTNNPPPAKDWTLVAAKGKDGEPGKAGSTTIMYSGDGGGADLNSLPVGEQMPVPTMVTVKQNGEWVQLPWEMFLLMIKDGLAPPLPGQVTVDGLGITVGGVPVFVTPSVLPGQVTVAGAGITVNGDPVFVTTTQQVFVLGEVVTVNNQPIEVTI